MTTFVSQKGWFLYCTQYLQMPLKVVKSGVRCKSDEKAKATKLKVTVNCTEPLTISSTLNLCIKKKINYKIPLDTTRNIQQ